MSDYYADKRYFVYRHVVPNGKMYIGITSKACPELRWGVGGSAYSKSNKYFWSAIQKYGWDNIQHIIVAHNLTVDQACRIEAYLIQKYDTFMHGYNQTSGGIYPTAITDEIRKTISHKVRAYHSSLPRGYWPEKFKGHTISAMTRRKLSARLKGRKIAEDVIRRRVVTYKANLTPEIRYKIGSSMRGKHLSEARVQKLREANTGKVVSNATRQKISENAKQRFSVKHIWVHKGDKELEIPEDKLHLYLADGYILGRSNIKNVYLTKDNNTIKVATENLDTYLAAGWVRGFSDSRYESLRKGQQKFVYTYKGMEFPTGKALAMYLRNNGYPKIVQGTINLICSGKVVKSYPELSAEIVRNPIHENI